MPRASQLTQEEVFGAIGELLADGEYPTSARLREALDHRGSPVVLQRFLSAWYEKFGPSLATAASAARPAAVAADLRAQLESATRQALAEFDRAHAERLAQLEDREAAAAAVHASLQARAHALDEREMAQDELIVDLRARTTAADDRRNRALEACARARGQRDAARRAEAALASQLAEARQHAVDVASLQAALQHARATSEREATRVVELAKERDDARAQARAALADATGLRQRLDAEREGHANTRVQAARALANVEFAEKRAKELSQRLDALVAQAYESTTALAGTLEDVRDRLAAAEGTGAAVQHMLGAVLLPAQTRLATQMGEVEALAHQAIKRERQTAEAFRRLVSRHRAKASSSGK